MRKTELISRIFGLLVLALLLTWLAEDANGQATDTYIGACASQQSCTLATNVSWAGGNQVWRFTAFQPDESIRIWILNHNPTNAHTSQTVQVWITDDSTVPSLLANSDRWVQACVTDNATTGAQLKNVAANNPVAAPGANGKATGYTVGMYAVQVAVRIIGAAAQAGNPDTFDIGIVQQPTTYPSGQQPGCDSSSAGYSPQSQVGLPLGVELPASDGFSNTVVQPAGMFGTGVTTASGLSVFPFSFNGTVWDRQFYCNKTTFISALGAATTQIVALSGTTRIRICSAVFSNTNATPSNVKLVEGTGVNCAGGQTQLTGNVGLGAAPSAFGFSQVSWITNVAGDALCATGSAAGAVDITLTFAQY